jgi:hypothetical protein
MPPNEHPAQTTSSEPTEDAIRENLNALLDLLAREVARRLPRQTNSRPKRQRQTPKYHPPSASYSEGQVMYSTPGSHRLGNTDV